MAKQLQHYWKRLTHWYLSLSQRERIIVGIVSGGLILGGLYQVSLGLDDYVKTNSRALSVRRAQLDDIHKMLERYVKLKARQENLQRTFAKSEMSFEQVTAQLDRIVRESMGNDNYDLKKSRTPTAFGFEYEKQEFTVNIRQLTIEQLIKLLYQLEQGEKPLFLSKVDIVRSSLSNDYAATLEIFSIAKAQNEPQSTSS